MIRLSRKPIARPEVRVLGIDPSLSSTGFSYRHSGQLYTGTIDSGKLRGPWRLYYIRKEISKVLEVARPTVIVMEDYAQGRGPSISMPFHIGELGGVLKTLFWESGIMVILVAPKSLKMIIAGTGKAKKPEMATALKATFGYTIPQHDEADALGLMLVGELSNGLPVVSKEVREKLRLHTLGSFPVIEGRLQSIANMKTVVRNS
jgi:Holliday junction resolvasome RuvABC endonuclease subunit